MDEFAASGCSKYKCKDEAERCRWEAWSSGKRASSLQQNCCSSWSALPFTLGGKLVAVANLSAKLKHKGGRWELWSSKRTSVLQQKLLQLLVCLAFHLGRKLADLTHQLLEEVLLPGSPDFCCIVCTCVLSKDSCTGELTQTEWIMIVMSGTVHYAIMIIVCFIGCVEYPNQAG